ncbi:MFS transporter [Umezawaea tangerina]|uniref:Putative MFS family arabinose efflux permease n=1 Tax=Umezawaea tangerina TaxID=84725 RepID=A0A2T0SSE0_9PSEU|nr:MFS transporter [Umezawaea tangerina]PRY36324.1 putative MFS family arabinose efflux permease [Umezawaea tangerina]
MPAPRLAVFIVFVFNGAVFGSWAARVPALAAQVGASAGTLGLALLGASTGLALTAPFAARACAAFGARRVVLASGVASAFVLPVLALAASPVQLGLALFLLGSSIAALDVSMNIAAVSVIRELDRPLMPQFHAGFSFGGLLGSLGAALAAWGGWTPLPHFLLAAALSLVVLALCCRAVPGGSGERHREQAAGPNPTVLRRPVLWLLAGIAFCSAIAEGASADWSALFLVRERGMGEAAAAAAYAVFSVTMACARLAGEPAQRRWGPYGLLTRGAVVAAVGLASAVLIPVPATGYLGFALAGLGLAFAFPVIMDLAGDAGRRADGTGGERELGLVTTVAYTGFLAGPPIVGGLAQLSSLTASLGFVTCVCVLIVPTVWFAARSRRRELAATRPESAPARP